MAKKTQRIIRAFSILAKLLNTISCACHILSNEIWYIRQNSIISLIARKDSMPYDKYDGEKRRKMKNAVRKRRKNDEIENDSADE